MYSKINSTVDCNVCPPINVLMFRHSLLETSFMVTQKVVECKKVVLTNVRYLITDLQNFGQEHQL